MANTKASFDRDLEERFLRYARTRQSELAEDETARNKPHLEMRWIIVTENGKRQLRMQWSVRKNTGASRQAA
jgi:hypothetical protein